MLADLRDPRAVIDHPDVRRVIDFDQPVALLLVAILHFITDAEKPDQAVAALRDALPAGSFLVLSHATGDFADRSEAQAVYNNATATLNLRTRAEVERFFDGFELVEPGLAQVPFWRPDATPPARSGEIGFYGAWLARSAEPASPAEEAARRPSGQDNAGAPAAGRLTTNWSGRSASWTPARARMAEVRISAGRRHGSRR